MELADKEQHIPSQTLEPLYVHLVNQKKVHLEKQISKETFHKAAIVKMSGKRL